MRIVNQQLAQSSATHTYLVGAGSYLWNRSGYSRFGERSSFIPSGLVGINPTVRRVLPDSVCHFFFRYAIVVRFKMAKTSQYFRLIMGIVILITPLFPGNDQAPGPAGRMAFPVFDAQGTMTVVYQNDHGILCLSAKNGLFGPATADGQAVSSLISWDIGQSERTAEPALSGYNRETERPTSCSDALWTAASSKAASSSGRRRPFILPTSSSTPWPPPGPPGSARPMAARKSSSRISGSGGPGS